ncbi:MULTISPECIES: hypothetical protein [unclassified Eikenella]|uniref:hypothetical protein n=1 Tax=unclassified Eikenella TaxID=2639367 RepID=UPI0007E27550|nr:MULTISPECIES: hypothetical protein [unclassified Eikenella]OAM28624.1 hypothetical protein A7P94_00920 [Eikenella sp. NML01-A-086]OAM41248.1 hypothetical protein A7Q02_08050 [Eikenella sp. NML97-A-109]
MQNLQYRTDIRIHQGFIQAAYHTFADWSNHSYNEEDTRQIIAKLLQLPEATRRRHHPPDLPQTLNRQSIRPFFR